MLKFGTKAQTLRLLAPKLERSLVGKSIAFSLSEWRTDQADVMARVKDGFSGEQVIVRSSARREDGAGASMAGAFESVMDVSADSLEALEGAVSRVITSYGVEALEEDEIFVQKMLADVSMSGVIFTHDLNTGAPYYVINYDDISGRTDTVTSGDGDTARTLLVHRGRIGAITSDRFTALLEAVAEIETFFPAEALDVEFAVTASNEIWLLQVRRLAVRRNWNRDVSLHVDDALKGIDTFLKSMFCPRPGVLGPRSLFGEMPDWNPAEMIGSVPRPLAKSLYEYLITDSVWAEARAELGYRDLSGRPLMVGLGGRVYIDVRESFNSYLPASLSDEIGEKLVSTWLDWLAEHPEEHDKIEFNTLNCYFPGFAKKLEALPYGLTELESEEVVEAYRSHTDQVLYGEPATVDTQLARIEELDRRRRAIMVDLQPGAELDTARTLLWDCANLGTRPFSVLARCGFIAESILRSFEEAGGELELAASALRSTVRTVLSEFLTDMHRLAEGDMEESDFLDRFGHLRPGTYDILSLRYDQRTDFIVSRQPDGRPAPEGDVERGVNEEHLTVLADALAREGLSGDVARFAAFVREAIEGREYAKLVFTRSLSDALELLAAWGETIGLSRSELSYLPLSEILSCLTTTPLASIESDLRARAKRAQEEYNVALALRLPYLVTRDSDAHVVPLLKSRPNFVTSSRVEAPLRFVSGQELGSLNATGCVVLVERADPGFDWIFLEPIAGLITRYGGSNSHMAIRCAELSVPAAIGCGEQLFDRLMDADRVFLDCAAGIVLPAS
jgi:glutamine kinase